VTGEIGPSKCPTSVHPEEKKAGKTRCRPVPNQQPHTKKAADINILDVLCGWAIQKQQTLSLSDVPDGLPGRLTNQQCAPLKQLRIHRPTRHGERSAHFCKAAVAQAVDLSEWQLLQAFGICNVSVSAGLTKRKVWLRTFTSAMVWAIFGM